MAKAKVTSYTYAEMRKMSQKELIALRVKYAKRANQRLVRLERSESPVTGKAYRAGAYDIAMDYLKNTRDKSGGAFRFSESANYTKTIDEETGKTAYDMYRIKRDILELQRFLSSKSSTVSGNKSIERKRIETFEAQGISIEAAESDEFYEFLNSNAYEYFTLNKFTSEEIIDIYSQFREAGLDADKIQAAFDELKEMDMESRRKAMDGITEKDIFGRLKKKASRKELERLAAQHKGKLL